MGDGAAHRRPPYHVAANLIALAASNWDEIDGILIMRGVDIWQLPLHRALNVLYALLAENRDEKERFKLQSQLDQPTPAQQERAREDIWWGHEQDAEAFAAAEKQLGGLLG